MEKKQKILIIVGPTASGKSDLAVKLARKFKGEVISADSRQVYRGLDIGTAKITKQGMKGVPHYLLNVVSPRKTFTAFDFVTEASRKIAEIQGRGHLPIIAGGTGFYIDALIGRISLPNVPVNLKLRAKLEKKTLGQLMLMLKQRDPKRAKTVEPDNKRRLIRALEITMNSKPDLRNPGTHSGFDALWIGSRPSETALRKKIRLRAATQLRRGLGAEVRRLRMARVPLKRIRELGFEYTLAFDYLDKKIARDEFLSRLESNTWRYAKRQLGYWRRNKKIQWFKPSDKTRIEREIRGWLRK